MGGRVVIAAGSTALTPAAAAAKPSRTITGVPTHTDGAASLETLDSVALAAVRFIKAVTLEVFAAGFAKGGGSVNAIPGAETKGGGGRSGAPTGSVVFDKDVPLAVPFAVGSAKGGDRSRGDGGAGEAGAAGGGGGDTRGGGGGRGGDDELGGGGLGESIATTTFHGGGRGGDGRGGGGGEGESAPLKPPPAAVPFSAVAFAPLLCAVPLLSSVALADELVEEALAKGKGS